MEADINVVRDYSVFKRAFIDAMNSDMHICGKCQMGFARLTDFQLHIKPKKCLKNYDIELNDMPLSSNIWAFNIWKNSPQAKKAFGKTIEDSTAMYRNWSELAQSVRDTWIKAADFYWNIASMVKAAENQFTNDNVEDIVMPTIKVENEEFDDVEEQDGETEYIVEKIVDKRFNSDNNCYEYCIKWEGFSSDENTWEPESNLTHCRTKINEFEAREGIRNRQAEIDLETEVIKVEDFEVSDDENMNDSGPSSPIESASAAASVHSDEEMSDDESVTSKRDDLLVGYQAGVVKITKLDTKRNLKRGVVRVRDHGILKRIKSKSSAYSNRRPQNILPIEIGFVLENYTMKLSGVKNTYMYQQIVNQRAMSVAELPTVTETSRKKRFENYVGRIPQVIQDLSIDPDTQIQQQFKEAILLEELPQDISINDVAIPADTKLIHYDNRYYLVPIPPEGTVCTLEPTQNNEILNIGYKKLVARITAGAGSSQTQNQ